MRHIAKINQLIEVLRKSDALHALVVESAPGWAKSTTIESALNALEIDYFAVGSYTTPLHLYNVFCDHPDKMIVLDDCAGLFVDAKAMAILKAATWQSTGSAGGRKITWGSSTEKVNQDSVIFTGNVILLTNHVPETKEARAFVSRTLYYRFEFTKDEVKELLREGAKSSAYYPIAETALSVAEFITSKIDDGMDHTRVNLRTLQVGYELAKANPSDWRELLETVTLASLRTSRTTAQTRATSDASPRILVSNLARRGEIVSQQLTEFMRQTGLSRRTFFQYRKELGLSRGSDGTCDPI